LDGLFVSCDDECLVCHIIFFFNDTATTEIYTIMMHRGTLVFVEVKARMSDSLGPPELAVDDRKQYRIRKAAAIFISRNRSDERPMRFDVVAITGDGRGRKVEHLKGAF
jgi:putative endonuclease